MNSSSQVVCHCTRCHLKPRSMTHEQWVQHMLAYDESIQFYTANNDTNERNGVPKGKQVLLESANDGSLFVRVSSTKAARKNDDVIGQSAIAMLWRKGATFACTPHVSHRYKVDASDALEVHQCLLRTFGKTLMCVVTFPVREIEHSSAALAHM